MNTDIKKLVKLHSEKINERIKSLYTARGLNQTTFAELMGVTQGKVSHSETTRNRLSMDYLLKAAAALGVKPADLLIGIESDYDQDDLNMLFKIHDVIQSKKKDPQTYQVYKKLML
jgi:transcriptional regulator with XRE-family HTH domain